MTPGEKGIPESAVPPENEIVVTAREALGAAIVFLAVLAVLYSSVIFRGKSLVYSDAPGSTEQPIERFQSPRFVPFATWERRNLLDTANFHDPGVSWWQWEPGGEFFREGLRHGEAPFWNPYIGCGTPEMTNLIDALFFPPYVALILLGNTDLEKNVYYLLIQFGAAFFLYLFLRKHALSRGSSLFGGIACILTGGLAQNIGSTIGQTSACLPFALYLTKRFIDRPSWKRTAGVALGYGSIALASFPPGLVAVFGFAASYAFFMLLTSRRRDFKRRLVPALPRYLVAVLLSMGLVAFYYLPTFRLIKYASQSTDLYQSAASASWPPDYAFQLLSPALTGAGKIYRDLPSPISRESRIPYVGVTVLIAAFLARRREGERAPLFSFVLIFFVLILLKLLGVPPVQWIAKLPILKYADVAYYFGFLLGYCLVILGALGIESLRREKATTRNKLVACSLATILVLLLYSFAQSQGILHEPRGAQWMFLWKRLVLVAVLGSLVVLCGSRLGRARHILLIATLCLEGFFNTVYPRPERWNIWKHPLPYEVELARTSRSARVMVAGALNANTNAAFDIYTMDSAMTFNSPRVFRTYFRYLGSQVKILMSEMSRVPPTGVLESANVGYLVVNNALTGLKSQALARGFSSIGKTAWVEIYRRPVAPRYFFTRSFRVSAPEAAFASLGTQKSVVPLSLEKSPGFPSSGTDEILPVVPVGIRRNSLRLSVDAPGPGLVYCSESNMPGWTARVNGKTATLYSANYAFRAVPVPRGHSEIELSYWPPGLTAGLVVSLMSFVALAAIFAARPERNRGALSKSGDLRRNAVPEPPDIHAGYPSGNDDGE